MSLLNTNRMFISHVFHFRFDFRDSTWLCIINIACKVSYICIICVCGQCTVMLNDHIKSVFETNGFGLILYRRGLMRLVLTRSNSKKERTKWSNNEIRIIKKYLIFKNWVLRLVMLGHSHFCQRVRFEMVQMVSVLSIPLVNRLAASAWLGYYIVWQITRVTSVDPGV